MEKTNPVFAPESAHQLDVLAGSPGPNAQTEPPPLNSSADQQIRHKPGGQSGRGQMGADGELIVIRGTERLYLKIRAVARRMTPA